MRSEQKVDNQSRVLIVIKDNVASKTFKYHPRKKMGYIRLERKVDNCGSMNFISICGNEG